MSAVGRTKQNIDLTMVERTDLKPMSNTVSYLFDSCECVVCLCLVLIPGTCVILVSSTDVISVTCEYVWYWYLALMYDPGILCLCVILVYDIEYCYVILVSGTDV